MSHPRTAAPAREPQRPGPTTVDGAPPPTPLLASRARRVLAAMCTVVMAGTVVLSAVELSAQPTPRSGAKLLLTAVGTVLFAYLSLREQPKRFLGDRWQRWARLPPGVRFSAYWPGLGIWLVVLNLIMSSDGVDWILAIGLVVAALPGALLLTWNDTRGDRKLDAGTDTRPSRLTRRYLSEHSLRQVLLCDATDRQNSPSPSCDEVVELNAA